MSEVNWSAHFQPGERLLWEGAPVPARVLTIWNIPPMLGGAVSTLFFTAMFVLAVVSLFFADSLIGAMGLLLLLAIAVVTTILSAAVAIGPFHTPAAQARHLRYAVTNLCGYLLRPPPKSGVERYPIAPLAATGIERVRGLDTVWFDAWAGLLPPECDAEDYAERVRDDMIRRVEFRNIADGEKVLALIRSLQNGVTV